MSLERLIGRKLRGMRPGMRSLASHQTPLSWLPDVIRVESRSFTAGETIPARYSRDGEGLSPELHWSGAPAETAAYALLVEDADPPMPRPFVHAIVIDIPAAVRQIAEGGLPCPGFRRVQPPGRMGLNSLRLARYMPPRPIRGHGVHRYVFQVYALSRVLEMQRSIGRGELIEAIAGHGLARGELVGLYERT